MPVKKKKSSVQSINRRVPKGDKGKRTKSLIQDAIIDLVSVEGLGLNDIKLDRICKKAKVTIGAFYFHFENKDAAIQETAIDCLFDYLGKLRALPRESDLETELGKIILIYIQSMVENPKAQRLAYTAIRSSPVVHKTYEDIHFEISDRLQQLISEQREELGLDTADSQLIVEFLLAGIESLVENVYLWGNSRMAALGEDPELMARKLAAMWVQAAAAQAKP